MNAVGQPMTRVDGRLKVTGRARYVAEVEAPGLLHACVVTSPLAAGRVLSIDSAEARRMPGFVTLFTHQNFPKLQPAPIALEMARERSEMKGSAGEQRLPLQDDQVVYGGQILAVVVADSFTHARAAAMRVKPRIEPAAPVLAIEDLRSRRSVPDNMWGEDASASEGHVDAALAASHATVEATYITPMMHHVAMEMPATMAHWDGGKLTLHEPTTWVAGAKKTLAAWLDLPPDNIRVLNEFVGGSFGSKGPLWPHVPITAVIARELRRPVRMHLTRPQTFTCAAHRPRIVHEIKLGADASGKLTAIEHTALQTASMFDTRIVAPVIKTTRKLYACDNIQTRMALAHANVPGPFTMRAPGEAPGLFALESAMDELAWKLGIDPLDLRLKNHADIDPETKHLWSSKHLRECYTQGAARFGWDKRIPTIGAHNRGDTLIGWGMATMAYDAKSAPAKASATLFADGRLLVTSSTCEQGTGSRTIMRQIAADITGLPVEAITFDLGDTDMPPAPISAGSMTTASVGSAVKDACEKLVNATMHLADNQGMRFRGNDLVALLRRRGKENLSADGAYTPGPEAKNFSRYSFGAHFAEVHIDALTRTIRVSRMLGAYAAGKIVNPTTARSQFVGGMIWGIGMTLTEHSELCPRFGRVITDSLADYLVPTNPDIGEIDVLVVPEEDPTVNPLGVKGIGELGIIGSTAAIANAVYHATGIRVRELPITPDKLLRAQR
jgi:xanthine dehydrogenase YagR molybdenum-binding subunit